MRKYLKKSITFAALLTLLFACALIITGCSSAPSDDSELRARGYMCATFDCNGGAIEGYAKRHLYALPGSPLSEPKENGKLPKPVLDAASEIEGWYEGSVGEDGEITFLRKWNFDTDKMGGEDITLYAKWIEKLRFTVDCGVKGAEDTYSEVLRYVSNFEPQSSRTMNMPLITPGWQDYTFISYFADAAHTVPLVWPITHSGESAEYKIYARYVKGDYTVVRSKDDFKSIGTFSNIYLLNDVDMTGFDWKIRDFSGSIIGDETENGEPVKISNLSLSIEQIGNYFQYTSFGLFGTLSGAKLKNVEFKDCSLVFSNTANRQISTDVGLLAGRITNGTTFENVKVSGNVEIINTTPLLSYNELYGTKSDNVDLSGCIWSITGNISPTGF